MKYLLPLLLFAFPLGQLARWNVASSEVVLHLNDIVVVSVLTFGLRRISGPLVKPLLLFALAILFSLAFNFTNFSLYELGVASLYPLRFFAYALLFFVSWPKETPRWLLLATLGTAGFGLLQYLFVPDVSFLAAQNWDDHYFRLVGSFLDPGFTGAILVSGLLLIFVNFKNLFTLLLVYLALALTYSRASYLMYLVSFAALAFYRKSTKIFLIATAVLLVILPLLPKSTGEGTKLERENSILARINNWKESLSIWQQAPIFGVGFNTYRYVRGIGPESHAGAGADSSILLVLATTGVFGLTAYCYLLTAMWKLKKNNLVFKVSFLGILVHSFFNNTLFYPWVMEWLWLLLALSPSDSRPDPKRRP